MELRCESRGWVGLLGRTLDPREGPRPGGGHPGRVSREGVQAEEGLGGPVLGGGGEEQPAQEGGGTMKPPKDLRPELEADLSGPQGQHQGSQARVGKMKGDFPSGSRRLPLKK